MDQATMYQVERAARKAKRLELEKLLHDECLKDSARYQRARHFAHQIMGTLRDFVPDKLHEQALEELMLSAIGLDVEIAQVPPDRDLMAKAAMDAALHGVSVTMIRRNEFFEEPKDDNP